jgi:hypothetical protein
MVVAAGVHVLLVRAVIVADAVAADLDDAGRELATNQRSCETRISVPS